MEFWGVEVKSGQSLPVYPGDDMIIHLSQATVGEQKKEKGSESICLYVTIDEKKLVIATLNTEKLPQQVFDLVFERKFELSHNWKNGSIFFYGYKATSPDAEFDEESDSEDLSEDEEVPAINGQLKKGKPEKPALEQKESAAKESADKKAKVSEPTEEEEDDSSDDDEYMNDANDDSDSDESDGDEDESDSDGEGEEDEEATKKAQGGKKKPAESTKKAPVPVKKAEEESDSDDDDDDEDDEEDEEETPKKVQSGKKRPADSSTKKAPLATKKVKLATPQKTDGKKGNDHVATPHPSKKSQKAGGKGTPKSAGSHKCKQCEKTFTTESGLSCHTKDKHTVAK